MSLGRAAALSGGLSSARAALAAPTARPANAALFFRKRRRPESFGFMDCSCGILPRLLAKGARIVNELVYRCAAGKLTGYLKMNRGTRLRERPDFRTLRRRTSG